MVEGYYKQDRTIGIICFKCNRIAIGGDIAAVVSNWNMRRFMMSDRSGV